MKKLCALLFLFWSVTSFSQAQQDTTTFFGKSSYIFEHLDKEQITTGLMSDYGIEFINVRDYNGSTVSRINFASIQEWRLLYTSLYSFQINGKIEMEQLETINARMTALVSQKKPITFALIDYRYQSMRDDAMSRNLITVQNDQLYDVPARQQSPYQSKRLFAVAPLSQTALAGKNLLIFRPEMYFGNSGKNIRSIAIDPGETGIFRNVPFNSPMEFSFPRPGFVPIAVCITYSDGSTVLGHTGLVVSSFPRKPPEQKPRDPASRTKTENLSQSQNQQITALKPFMGQLASGNLSIRFGKGNLNKSIRKPLIIIREAGFEHIHSYGPNDDTISSLSAFTALKDINTGSIPGIPDSYDIIYLNLSDPTDYIQRNAYLLERTIDYINTLKTTYLGKSQDNVILGLGTGGLIARYALRDMELKNQDHQTRVFISHDTPHHGINIPAGYQAALQHLSNFAFFMTDPSALSSEVRYIRWEDIFPEILEARDTYNTPAARQMLIQRYFLNQQNHQLSPDNLDYQNFYSTLDSMGWPRKSNNFVMANGSGQGRPLIPENSPIFVFNGNEPLNSDINQPSKPAGKETLLTATPQTVYHTAEASSSFPLQLPSGHYTKNMVLKIDFIINAVPERGTTELYRGNLSVKRKMPWIKNRESYIMKASVLSIPGMLPLDSAPGSPLTEQTTDDHPVKMINKIPAFISSTGKRKERSEFCFVPTVSALAIMDPWRNLKRNIRNDIAMVSPETINGYFSPDENQGHLSFTPFSINQILQWQDTTSDDKK